ncbi:MAG: DUF3311 domain-containing protein [Verrucomicrobiae bacterium]|nr:DUF3311 domain-containing protein [Verrucomicrobiae bacterium]
MKTVVVLVLFLVLTFLHQDDWYWNDKTLWFGFLPAGLGYHAIYSVVAALFWYLVSKFAWPHKTEEWAEQGDA